MLATETAHRSLTHELSTERRNGFDEARDWGAKQRCRVASMTTVTHTEAPITLEDGGGGVWLNAIRRQSAQVYLRNARSIWTRSGPFFLIASSTCFWLLWCLAISASIS